MADTASIIGCARLVSLCQYHNLAASSHLEQVILTEVDESFMCEAIILILLE